ncbi:hypothetical protein H0H81_002523, partial [Sphagnurus paluster]
MSQFTSIIKESTEFVFYTPSETGMKTKFPIFIDQSGPREKHVVHCDICQTLISVEASGGSTVTGNLSKHRRSAKCLERAAVNVHQGSQGNQYPQGTSVVNPPAPIAPSSTQFQPRLLLHPPESMSPHFMNQNPQPSTFSAPVITITNTDPEPVNHEIDSCPGQIVEWYPGSVWETYAYQQHDDPSMTWTPVGFEGSKYIIIRSNSCSGKLSQEELLRGWKVCKECCGVINSPRFKNFIANAEKDSVKHTPYAYLSSRQLKCLVVETKRRLHSSDLNMLNLKRKINQSKKKLTDYQQVVMLLTKNKIAGVSRILSISLQKGSSPEAISLKLEWAIDGTYVPCTGWTERDYDVTFLIKAMGGPQLLYALQKAEAYLSLTTLRKRHPIPELIVSEGIPTQSEIDGNIESFLTHKEPTNLEIGQIVMINGVAIEEVARYDFGRNLILGLCREHAANIPEASTTINTIEDLEKLASLIDKQNPIRHYGKDATVLAIAPVTGEINYHPVPLLVTPSCKKEAASRLTQWIKKFLDAYHQHPQGASRHGPITAIATDGESSFRRMRFDLCLTVPLAQDTAMAQTLYNLPGINCMTGPYGILGTCDPKHILKRFATMLRSPKGTQIGDSGYGIHDVLEALRSIPSLTDQQAKELLNLMDKQNVPKAVYLLQCLAELPQEPTFSLRPSLAHKLSIGAEVNAILQRNPDLDRGHVRRNLINVRGIDHINPKSWTGDVCVSEVNVQEEYIAGKADAIQHLESFDPSLIVVFNTLFQDCTKDHLRPKGDYVGYSETGNITADEAQDDSDEFDAGPIIGILPVTPPMDEQDRFTHPKNTQDFVNDDQDQDRIINQPLNPTTIDSAIHYIMVEGHKMYKPTLISEYLNAERADHAKVTTRLLQVRGVTIKEAVRANLRSGSDELDNVDDQVKSGDLGAILVRCGQRICLAVAEAISFYKGKAKTKMSSISVDALDKEGNDQISILVQILQLRLWVTTTSNEAEEDSAEDEDREEPE